MTRGHKVLLAVALILASASTLLSSILFTRLATTTDRTNKALCTFRADVRQRATATETFLKDHPQGIPGVPNATLRQGLQGQRRTVKALRQLDCK